MAFEAKRKKLETVTVGKALRFPIGKNEEERGAKSGENPSC